MTNDAASLAKDVLAGSRRALAKAITLIEDSRAEQRAHADDLLAVLMNPSTSSIRIGVSGIPGVGKSTFIESFGLRLIQGGHKVAVLAVDPSSPLAGGSILGDKTRMPQLAAHKDAFIRPSPAKTTLGGVGRRTREAIILCEAAGYDRILVETVGVGQSEVTVASMVDTFLMLQMPRTGDELQGIKKGILEMADLIAVTKADGPLASACRQTKVELERALSLVRQHESWKPPVLTCSGLTGSGIDEVIASIEEFLTHQRKDKAFVTRRQTQNRRWFSDEIVDQIKERILSSEQDSSLIHELEDAIDSHNLLPTQAAARLLDSWKQS